MKWVTYRAATGAKRTGLLVGDLVHGASTELSLLDVLELGPEKMRELGADTERDPAEVLEVADTTLLAPIRPTTIRDGAGFLQHLRNNAKMIGSELDPRFLQFPPFYFGNAGAIVGPGQPVRRPPGCERLDYELEIGAVIGRPGADIPVARANEHIAGYLIFCDWSARDLQIAERGLFGQMKGKDFANSIGPALVTPDEIEDLRSERGFKIQMTAFVNGEQTTDGFWDGVDWDFPDSICFASRGVSLMPGDVIGSGTVPSGCLAEAFSRDSDNFRGWLQPGDEVLLRVERLGEMRHTILDSRPVERLTSGY